MATKLRSGSCQGGHPSDVHIQANLSKSNLRFLAVIAPNSGNSPKQNEATMQPGLLQTFYVKLAACSVFETFCASASAREIHKIHPASFLREPRQSTVQKAQGLCRLGTPAWLGIGQKVTGRGSTCKACPQQSRACVDSSLAGTETRVVSCHGSEDAKPTPQSESATTCKSCRNTMRHQGPSPTERPRQDFSPWRARAQKSISDPALTRASGACSQTEQAPARLKLLVQWTS